VGLNDGRFAHVDTLPPAWRMGHFTSTRWDGIKVTKKSELFFNRLKLTISITIGTVPPIVSQNLSIVWPWSPGGPTKMTILRGWPYCGRPTRTGVQVNSRGTHQLWTQTFQIHSFLVAKKRLIRRELKIILKFVN